MTPTKTERLRQLLSDLEAEARVIDDMVAPLAHEDWTRSTTAEGWTIRDQVTHLAYFDQAAEMSVGDPERFRTQVTQALSRGTNLPDDIARTYRPIEPTRRGPGSALRVADCSTHSLRPIRRLAYRGSVPT